MKRHAPDDANHRSALKVDPAYAKILRSTSHDNRQAFTDAFARAWRSRPYRDMGPRRARLPAREGLSREALIWQDLIPP
ncbi:MAG: hypothetical protein IPQ07_37425 [Myxococcales bacterium]|nr:hypothetical protein [Myxococcales bacterium]